MLDRPDKRNALHAEMITELTKAFSEAARDPEVRVVLLEAAGVAFSAGADLGYLEQLEKNSPAENLEDSRKLAALYQLIYRHPKLLIAAVQGDAIAGGCGLVTVCDLCYAVPGARFGYTEVRIGFIPALVSVFLVPRIGEARARELLLTGRLISAEEATRIGLITGVLAEAELVAGVRREAIACCEGLSGESVARTKQLLADIRGLGLEDALRVAAAANAEARTTADCRRGIRAFLTRQSIQW